jgi:molybdopterin-guanine dinucleotide biosynthesis protein A
MKAKRPETDSLMQVRFSKALQDLWPVAAGSLSLRKSPCVRDQCQACLANEGHRSHVLYGKTGNKRFSLYVPERLVPQVRTAIRNGKRLQELISEAGVLYVKGLKEQSKEESQ